MKTSSVSFWHSGAVPLIESENLSEIIASASDISLVVDTSGTVLSVVVSPAAESFGNLSHWEGRPIVDFLAEDSIGKFQRAHARFLEGNDVVKPLELNHEDNASFRYPVRYTFHRFGSDGIALLLGRDLRPIAEAQQQLVQAQIALEQGYEARRAFDSRYRVMLSQTREAIVFVDVHDGRISDCSPKAAELLGVKRDSAAGAPFAPLLVERSSAELMESLLNASLAEGGGRIEGKSARTGTLFQIEPTVFRASGQRVLLCTLSLKSDTSRTTDGEAARAAHFVRAAADGIVFTDATGAILSVNDSFLDLVGASHGGDVRGKSLGDYLARGQIDLGVLVDNLGRSGQMRCYATKFQNELGARLSVEISASKITETAQLVLAFVIRDVSRVEGVRQASGAQGADDGNRNAMELVGSASLKEIVAETTDVVEKMCIETAVNLTKNNRVAAAEMLGLSRQSLYVKLRKYGLLSKDG